VNEELPVGSPAHYLEPGGNGRYGAREGMERAIDVDGLPQRIQSAVRQWDVNDAVDRCGLGRSARKGCAQTKRCAHDKSDALPSPTGQGEYALKGCTDGDLVDYSAYEVMSGKPESGRGRLGECDAGDRRTEG